MSNYLERIGQDKIEDREEIESNKAYFTTLLEEQRVQLAKAEQRVAEACALYIHSTKGAVGSINMAEAVLSGEWRKFVKEN